VNRRGLSGIFIFRLTPFTRGYASIISGLLQIKPGTFLSIAFGSALTWSAFYVATGYLIGPYWTQFIQNIDYLKYILIAILAITLGIFLITHWMRKRNKINSESVIN
jgi:membrane protein DedA with SNARE-associated domain